MNVWKEHEIIWIEAVLVLLPSERKAAFEDIAEMTGRTYADVYRKANDVTIKQAEAQQAKFMAWRQARRLFVPGRSNPCPQRAPGQSSLRQPTKAQKMGARA